MTQCINQIAEILGFIHDEASEERVRDLNLVLEYIFSNYNIENDSDFRERIGDGQKNFIPIGQLLCNHVFENLGYTAANFERLNQGSDFYQAVSASPNLEIAINSQNQLHSLIRRVVPFQSDPKRMKRTVIVRKFNDEADIHTQRKFFHSIFDKNLISVIPQYKITNNTFHLTGETIIELSSKEEAEKAVRRKIRYGDGVLDVCFAEDVINKARGKSTQQSKPLRHESLKLNK